jgi:hypothetical protein
LVDDGQAAESEGGLGASKRPIGTIGPRGAMVSRLDKHQRAIGAAPIGRHSLPITAERLRWIRRVSGGVEAVIARHPIRREA